MLSEKLLRELESIAPVRRDEPLARHTTFGIGGPADAYVVADSAQSLRRIVAACRSHGAPFFVLGSGSNVLVGDEGIRGLTIENRAAAVDGPFANGDGFSVQAESGASIAALARSLARQGCAGLEWASGIPGTVGGAVVYNAGAYGGSLADVLRSASVIDDQGHEQIVAADELGLAYRGSALTRDALADAVVLSAEFHLEKGSPQELTARVKELDAERVAAQPRGRSAGSVFKNTPERPAWWLIDQAGLRGHRIGDAQVSPKHTNFILNVGQARAADVKALIDLAREQVRERFGLELELEISLVGEGF
jgi:UDP-N-acetylmuramate dehydrogenase